MSSRTRLLVLAISTPLLAFVVVGGLLGKTRARDDAYRHLRIFEDVISLVTNNYVEEVEINRVMTGALRGLADNLDADSAYLSAEQVTRIERDAPDPEAGVGLALTRRYYLRTIAARDGSPAARAGLAPGDYIRAIDGRPTRDMSVFDGTRLLRGEAGSVVSLTVIRGNAADPQVLELTRETPALPSVSARVVAPGVGYLRISAFAPNVIDLVEAEATALRDEPVTSLVVDVRRTASGPLAGGLAAARLFVSDGVLGSLETRGEEPRPVVAGPGAAAITLPVIVLIDAGTAGAAELFAAALAGNDRAELVGEPTVGRAGVQELVKLPDGSGLWLTHGRYLDPSDEAIHEAGLEPDVHVDSPIGELGATPPDTDPILERALEHLALKNVA